jgi:RNA polymerase sigma-70 factor (ECF subfamily)
MRARAVGVDIDQEQNWVRRASAGDRDAFAVLVARYWGPVRAWLTGLTGQVHLAEDLTQEAFLKAWVALPTLAAAETFRVWLFRIARNEHLAAARRPRSASDPALDLADPAPGPSDAAIEREEEAALRTAVGKLPTTYREAYLLWTHERLSYPEIARILEVTEETARWRVCEARRRLTRVLEKFLTP